MFYVNLRATARRFLSAVFQIIWNYKLEFADQLLWRGSALPPSDEGGAPKGRRERNKLQSLGFFSPPVSFADSPLVRGGRWGAVHDGAPKCNLTTAGTIPSGFGQLRQLPHRARIVRGDSPPKCNLTTAGTIPSVVLRAANQKYNDCRWQSYHTLS